MGETPAAKKHRPFKRCAQVVGRTASKAWDDSIFGKSATAAFWQTLSLPPLLLGLLGSLGYVGGWFGPNTVEIIQSKIITFSHTVFSENVVDQIIQPPSATSSGAGGRRSSRWAFCCRCGRDRRRYRRSSIRSSRPTASRTPGNPVWQRVFALLLYVGFLILAVFTLPLVALGPTIIGRVLPESWHTVGTEMVDAFYYPAVGLLLIIGLTTLYKVALPKSLPWHDCWAGHCSRECSSWRPARFCAGI
ncbi:hypothetical protein GS937_13850 [Rhodococcus hoagii]|nr:hypothetical protein [Prescottella equi]